MNLIGNALNIDVELTLLYHRTRATGIEEEAHWYPHIYSIQYTRWSHLTRFVSPKCSKLLSEFICFSRIPIEILEEFLEIEKHLLITIAGGNCFHSLFFNFSGRDFAEDCGIFPDLFKKSDRLEFRTGKADEFNFCSSKAASWGRMN